MFLACVGSAAHSVFRTFKFEDEADKAKVDKITDAFEKYCIGEANETCERFLFHQRIQQPGENFDDFLADLRKLAVTCAFATLEDSLIRDRIVIGIRDDATRRRLLQTKKLSPSLDTVFQMRHSQRPAQGYLPAACRVQNWIKY